MNAANLDINGILGYKNKNHLILQFIEITS